MSLLVSPLFHAFLCSFSVKNCGYVSSCANISLSHVSIVTIVQCIPHFKSFHLVVFSIYMLFSCLQSFEILLPKIWYHFSIECLNNVRHAWNRQQTLVYQITHSPSWAQKSFSLFSSSTKFLTKIWMSDIISQIFWKSKNFVCKRIMIKQVIDF